MSIDGPAEQRARLSPERWKAVTNVVDGALELAPEQRAAYIARCCGDDAELKREAERFLRACEGVDMPAGFLAQPAAVYAAPVIDEVEQREQGSRAAMLREVATALAPRYVVERELGHGGMATVYLAQDAQHGRRVAIKLMHDDLSRLLGADRFLREIRITAALRHLNIVPLYDSGNVHGLPYFVMPYIEGESLASRLARERQLALADALRIVRDVGDALDYAHSNGVVHRDVKPQNILLEGGRALVMDFGVARAVSVATTSPASLSAALGTPLYMSPEQASGDPEVTARSDVYALGVVLYEMLAGEPPFTAPNVQALLAKHMNAPVPDLRVVRPSVGAEVQRVIEKALAKLPVERYASAGELVHAFERAVTATTTAATKSRRYAPVLFVAGVAVVLWLLSRFGARAGVATSPATARSADTTQVVLFPFEKDTGPGSPGTDDLVREAFARWRGITVLDPSTVDTLARAPAPRSAADAASLVLSLGAGRFVRGRVAALGRAWRVDATLFDAPTRRALYQAKAEVPGDATLARNAYERLADALLLRGDEADSSGPSARSSSLPAMQAMRRGLRSLEDWDLLVAESSLQTAVGFDPTYPRASLLLAQVRAWRSLPAQSWSSLAERAYAGASELPERERRLALPLVLLVRGEYATACREYAKLQRANDRDFAAWFGLGQCRAMDKTVVPDERSPSGWRFRSSYHSAVESYARAFAILPSVHRGYEHDGFSELRALLFVSTDLVDGYGSDAKRSRFYARPALQGDTLALIPYPWQIVFTGAHTVPRGFDAALARQRRTFRRIADGWSTAFPASAGAKLAVAIALELLDDASAIDTIRLARTLAPDSARERSLAAKEALLHVKFGAPDDLAQLRAARSLIDTLLLLPLTSSSEAAILAPLAALTGRCALTEELFKRVVPASARLPGAPHLFAMSQSLLARVALGCARGTSNLTLSSLANAIDREQAGGSADDRRWLDAALLYRPALLASPLDSAIVERLAAATGGQLLSAARALVRRDTSAARQELTAFGAQWNEAIGVTPDIGYMEATLWAQTGDTSAAVLWLNRTLNGASSYDPAILADPARAAAFVRAMLLRADLAWRLGDRAEARRWGAAVQALWSGADEDLRSALQRVAGYVVSR